MKSSSEDNKMMWSYGENNHAYGNIRFVAFLAFFGRMGRQKKESIVLSKKFVLDWSLIFFHALRFFLTNCY